MHRLVGMLLLTAACGTDSGLPWPPPVSFPVDGKLTRATLSVQADALFFSYRPELFWVEDDMSGVNFYGMRVMATADGGVTVAPAGLGDCIQASTLVASPEPMALVLRRCMGERATLRLLMWREGEWVQRAEVESETFDVVSAVATTLRERLFIVLTNCHHRDLIRVSRLDVEAGTLTTQDALPGERVCPTLVAEGETVILRDTTDGAAFVRSIDAGATWSPPATPGNVSGEAPLLLTGGELVTAAPDGAAMISTDGGQTFAARGATSFQGLAFAGPTGTIATVDDDGLHVSSDGWRSVATHALPVEGRHVAALDEDGGTLWLLAGRQDESEPPAASAALFHSGDGGLTWQQAPGKMMR